MSKTSAEVLSQLVDFKASFLKSIPSATYYKVVEANQIGDYLSHLNVCVTYCRAWEASKSYRNACNAIESIGKCLAYTDMLLIIKGNSGTLNFGAASKEACSILADYLSQIRNHQP